MKKVHKSAGTDDKKLQAALKKTNVQPIQAIEEVNMFKSDGNVIHFSAPKGTFCLDPPILPSPLPIFPTLPPTPPSPNPNPAKTLIQPKPKSQTDSPSTTTVHASVPANTFAIYGAGEDKELTELVPGILNQLGPDSLASLRRLAESYQSMQKEKGGEDGSGEKKDGAGDDDDDIPDLVEGTNFEGGKEGEVE